MLDARDLGRQPGSTLPISREVSAPAELGTEIIAVAEGSPVRFELRLDSLQEGVFVSGTVSALAIGQCGRCLTDLKKIIRAQVSELYGFPDRPENEDDEVEVEYLLDGDLLDFEPVLRDAVVSALPFQPVCRADCPGLCSECGIALVEDPEHHHDVVDPRWSALQGIAQSGDSSDPEKDN